MQRAKIKLLWEHFCQQCLSSQIVTLEQAALLIIYICVCVCVCISPSLIKALFYLLNPAKSLLQVGLFCFLHLFTILLLVSR